MFDFETPEQLVKFVLKAKLPDWQCRLFRKYAEAVQVHSRGELFYKLDRLFPNEHPDSKAHRILSFESVTEPSFGRAANNVNRIFRYSSYTIEASEETIRIADEHVYDGKNFYISFLNEWEKWALREDPNARIAFYPPEYVEEGHHRFAFIGSDMLRHLSEHMVVFVSEEESEMKYDLQELRVHDEWFYDQSVGKWNRKLAQENTFTPILKGTVVRPVFHVFHRDKGFYRIEQTKDGSFTVDHYPYKTKFLPVTDVGGIIGKNGVCKSFLHPFVPFGNLALLQHSQHTAVNFTYSFPRMSEIHTPCDAEGCIEGKIECDISDAYPDGYRPCKRCGGTGFSRNQTPYKVYIKKYDPQAMEGETKHLEVDDVKFYTPPTGILEYSKQEWKNYLEMAETAVYIQQRVQTGNVQSAQSKEIDRDDMYSFLSKVGQVYFTKLRFGLQCIENYHVANPSQVVVNPPYSYAIVGEEEAFTVLEKILTSNVSVVLKANQVESFLSKFVSQSSPIRKFMEVLKLVDLLLYYTDSQIPTLKSNNIVTAEMWATHVYAFPVLLQMYQNDRNLFLEETQTIAERLKAELKKYKPVGQNEDLRQRLLRQFNGEDPLPNEPNEPPGGEDVIGKIPLAIQQLSLAANRAMESGNTELAAQLNRKIQELLNSVAT